MLTAFILFVASFFAWLVSTLAGGGGGMLMIPVVAWVANPRAVAPAITLGHILANPVRVFLFWRDIEWRIVRWYLPAAVVGAVLGGYIFAKSENVWLQIAAGGFLVSTAFQYRFGQRQKSFPMRLPFFAPIGFVVALVSGVIGEAGPVLNPFYLNFGVTKERMIATKAVNSFFMHLTKLAAYGSLGALNRQNILYGIAIGLGASLASWMGRAWLVKLKEIHFRQIVVGVMVVTGAIMLWQGASHLIHAKDPSASSQPAR